jgi:hypothetical protein
MKKFLFLICGVLLFATSCLDSGNSGGSSSAVFVGKLVVSDVDTGEVSYSVDNASIEACIPNMFEAKFDFIFNKIKFDDAMPVKLNLAISGVPFSTTISEDKTTINYLFKGEDIVPTAGGLPYERFKVGVIEGCIGQVVEVRFTVPSKGKHVYFTNAESEAEPSAIE